MTFQEEIDAEIHCGELLMNAFHLWTTDCVNKYIVPKYLYSKK